MKKLTITLFAFVICLSAFAQLKKFNVEIPVQPKIRITDSIQSFTILNRSITPNHQNFIKDSLQVSFYRKNFKVNELLLDSVAADTTIKVLGDLLFNSQRFDVVIPKDCTVKRTNPINVKNEPLDWEYVEEVCQTYNTDALIVLENLPMYTVTNFSVGQDYNYYPQKSYYASMDFYSSAHWRVYYPKDKSIIIDISSKQDTLYWDSYKLDLLEVFQTLPSVKEASIETGIYAAKKFSEKISTQWKEVSRFYYVMKNTSIDQSIEYAANGEWEKALDNWKQYTSTGNKKEQSKIMLNVALAYEMVGDLASAIEWTKKSISIYYRELGNYYLKELITRKKSINSK